LSGTTWVSRYQNGKTNLDFTEARDSEWQWYQLGHMQVCTSPQTDNHASTPPLRFLQAGCSSCRPTNSVKALKALDADAVINNLSQKVGGSNAYPDPAPKKVGGSGPRKTHRIYAPECDKLSVNDCMYCQVV